MISHIQSDSRTRVGPFRQVSKTCQYGTCSFEFLSSESGFVSLFTVPCAALRRTVAVLNVPQARPSFADQHVIHQGKSGPSYTSCLVTVGDGAGSYAHVWIGSTRSSSRKAVCCLEAQIWETRSVATTAYINQTRAKSSLTQMQIRLLV